MSHTNSTTNYNLPQFIGTDKPTWLNDVNGAFSAIDTQMKANADSATSAGTSATTANNAIGTLSSLETTAKTDLVTAINEVNTNVGVAQNTANGASQTANQTNLNLNAFIAQFNLENTSDDTIDVTGGTSSSYRLAQNSLGTIFKFYGCKRFNGNCVLNRKAIQGLSGYYGCDTGLVLSNHPTNGYFIKGAGLIYVCRNDETGTPIIYEDQLAVGSDGHLYIWAGQSTGNITVPSTLNYKIWFPPCLYFNTDFGDTPSDN